jgi:serine/threonine protein kinase
LNDILLGKDHIALHLPMYEMDLRKFLDYHRQPALLNKIFHEVIEGVQQLHDLGFVHRDLKPDNIVLNVEPLKVAVIDFDISCLDTAVSKDSKIGTKGYYPNWFEVRDGNYNWDIWAIGAMILEANLPPRQYIVVNS